MFNLTPDLLPDIWGLASIVAKFGLYLGVLTAAGTVFAALLFRLDQYRYLALSFALLGLLMSVLAFMLGGAMLTGDATGLTDYEMLNLLWDTPVGTALSYRVIGLSILILGLITSLLIRRSGLWVAVFGGVLATWSLGQIGHIADRHTILLDIALLLHLLAVALWIGVLTPLKRLASQSDALPQAADLGHRFGLLASVTVPLLIIAGGYMSYQLVGSFSALLGTGYGQTLVLKVVFVAVLLSLAAANKLRFIPGLKRDDPRAALHLVRSISFEWIAVLMILGATAVLTSTVTLPN